jgi:tetratricopeptide (TPR) repeat protein
MGKKKLKKDSKKKKPSKSIGNPPNFKRKAMEKKLSDISELLGPKEFASINEVNAFLNGIISPKQNPSSPELARLKKAQDLIYDAWESSGKRRVELARRALEISRDCADAYALLAEETARSLEEGKQLYEMGVKAGERALGPKAFKEDLGHFWGILETRPYMRARAGLAQSLWLLGERQQAIEHYREMLRLNPGDNQGIRYILANCLMEEGLDEALGILLNEYQGEVDAAWLYPYALWIFRREGASPAANASLKKAVNRNRLVPPYLLGGRKLPKHLPEYISLGGESEAVAYAAEAIEGWRKTPGALEWLMGQWVKLT